jgi:group I intron endonuclease
MKIFYIYKITNLKNNKVYIGQTCQHLPRERFNRHIREARNGTEGVLYNAIRKYGESNFNFELLICCSNLKNCNDLEIEFISLYNATNRKYGYNVLSGGKQTELTNEIKFKISEKIKLQFSNGRKPWNSGFGGKKLYNLPSPWNTGKKGQYKLNHGKNVSKALSGIPKSKEHRKKLAEAKKKYHQENDHIQAKQVKCLTTGEIFKSVAEAAKYFNCKNAHISRVCRGERNHYKQLKFEYINRNDTV